MAVLLAHSYWERRFPGRRIPRRSNVSPIIGFMDFVMDRAYRGLGLGGAVLEAAIARVCQDFGPRPIVLCCQEDNRRAAAFYERHGFHRTEYRDDDDFYYLRPLPDVLGEAERRDARREAPAPKGGEADADPSHPARL